MRFQTLSEWLQWQEQLHPKTIDLGLSRVHEVWRRMHADDFTCPVITVAGTNGKGSCVAMLQAIYLQAGYAVGSYTSPHLWRYNERICISGKPVTDDMLCEAFAHVDAARHDVSLTYFEFGTLAALDIFKHQDMDVVILEVGLGGRLDAVNIIDADVALITSIDLDHQQWLGNDRESIGQEKAGILRGDNVGVLNDPSPPVSVKAHAQALGNHLSCLGKDYNYHQEAGSWRWHSDMTQRVGLPIPALSGEHQLRNAAGVMMVIESLQTRLPVSQIHIRQGLLSIHLPGRFQLVAGEVTRIYDVAHNPAASQQLASTIKQARLTGSLHVVFSAMSDKDIGGTVAPLCELAMQWHIAPLDAARSATSGQLSTEIRRVCPDAVINVYEDLETAFNSANQAAETGDIILTYGSFYAVAQASPDSL